jgi:transcriptional regulator with XRE-family HTH domain
VDTHSDTSPISPDRLRVGGNLRRLRERSSLSLSQIAAALTDAGRPMDESAVSKLERGLRTITVEDLFALALIHDRPVGSLLVETLDYKEFNAMVDEQYELWRDHDAQIAELDEAEARAWQRIIDYIHASDDPMAWTPFVYAEDRRSRRLVHRLQAWNERAPESAQLDPSPLPDPTPHVDPGDE